MSEIRMWSAGKGGEGSETGLYWPYMRISGSSANAACPPKAASGPFPCLEVTWNEESFLTFGLAFPLEFELSWEHSVEGEEWREQFIAAPNGSINLEATQFRTFGAGVPNFAPETTLEGGWVRMSGFDRIVDPLVIRVNDETQHTLTIGGQTFPLEAGQYRFKVTESCPEGGEANWSRL